jgi:hypothetical protein
MMNLLSLPCTGVAWVHCVRYCVRSLRQGPIFGEGNAGRVRELPEGKRHFVGLPDPKFIA